MISSIDIIYYCTMHSYSTIIHLPNKNIVSPGRLLCVTVFVLFISSTSINNIRFVVLIRSLHLVWLSVSLASSSLHFFMSPVHATLHPRACLQRMGFFSTNDHVQERNRISRSQRTHHASNTHFAALRRVEGLLKLRA